MSRCARTGNWSSPLSTLERAIERRNPRWCQAGTDAAGSDFQTGVADRSGEYLYEIDRKTLTTSDLFDLYEQLCAEFDVGVSGGSSRGGRPRRRGATRRDQSGADQNRRRRSHGQRCRANQTVRGPFDAVILKPNQIISFSRLYAAFDYCTDADIEVIVSQRSGETDTPTIVNLGLGSEHLKIGPPARERIVKYNHL